MTRTIIIYTEAYIYQVISPNNTNLRYVGATGLNVHRRLACHKAAWKRHKRGLTTNVSVNEIFNIDPNAEIEILHTLTNCTDVELMRLETWYIQNLRDVVNRYKCIKNKNDLHGVRLLQA
jgi:hypothetical protein